MAESPRRFSSPWRTDKIANGQALAYLYSRDNEAAAR
jgi:hypothetical protein